jgi:spermidine/putrescine transport system substrate-binding protein
MNDDIARATRTPISRRRFIQGSGLAGFAAFLAACGTSGTGTASPGGASATPGGSAPSPSGSGEPSQVGGELNFANWIGYMDVSEDGNSFPTLEEFTAATGITVNYDESIDDNETFFTSDLQGPLSQGLPSEWDIVVVTDWMVARLARLGWLDTIDTSRTPNFPANLLEQYIGRSFDPDTNLAAPWQSGMTGLGFDMAQTGELTSLDALWDTQYAGKVTYLSEMRDTVGLAAIRLGHDPADITREQFDEALAEIQKAVDDGVVRQVIGNSYVEDMAGGGAILGMAWSGDVLSLLVPDQTAEQDFQFRVAEEGGMLWTDNMVIPKGAPNKAQAETWIDYYYQPEVAAQVEAWVNYVCPVKGAREVLLDQDPEIGENPLIFPPDDVVARLHQFRALDGTEEQEWSEAFAEVQGL